MPTQQMKPNFCSLIKKGAYIQQLQVHSPYVCFQTYALPLAVAENTMSEKGISQ